MTARSPFHVLIKPIGPVCNIDCEYCFYLEKTELFPGHRTIDFMMSEETLENATRAYIEAQPVGTTEVNFAWQGGEPTLMGVGFFRKAVELQQRYARRGMAITNAIQTNATRLDGEWGEFLRDHRFLVGVSIDGPEDKHNRYRKDRGGAGTFNSVMRGIDLLKKHRVEFNTLTVVQDHNSEFPAQTYTFLKKIGSTFMQFIPIVEKTGESSVGDRSVDPQQWGRFMTGVFREWIKKDVGRVFVQHFDMLLGLWMGYPASMCVHAETCGRAVALEHDGGLYSCDHFVTHQHHLGVFQADAAVPLVDGPAQTRFGENKRDLLPGTCRACQFRHLCHGACPKDRGTFHGVEGLNYLCPGYFELYRYTEPFFKAMSETLRRQLPASEFRGFLNLPEGFVPNKNSLCPCGSGKKYKVCHGSR